MRLSSIGSIIGLGVGLMVAATFPVKAAGRDFQTSIFTTIDAHDTALTHVSHTIEITNQQSGYYLQRAVYIIESHQPKQVEVSGSTKISSEIDGRKITVNFLTPQIGKGKTLTLHFSYTADDLIYHDNQNIIGIIPPLGAENTASRSATIMLPASIKALGFSSPQFDSIHTDQQITTLQYNQLSNETIVFRENRQQYLQLQLQFQLSNSNMTPIETQVALPPDTDYQRVINTRIDPQPVSLSVDPDHNVIATFHLEPNETKKIVSTHTILLSTNPYTSQPINPNHTVLKQHWTLASATLKKLPHLNMPLNPEELYRLIPQLSASTKLDSPAIRSQAQTCMSTQRAAAYEDCIDALITLLRSQSIPVRRNVGIPVIPLGWSQQTTGSKPYVWLEYFDKSINHWIPLDPATELAINKPGVTASLLNQVAFVINGVNDASPLSAYSYSANDMQVFTLTPATPSTPEYNLEAVLSRGDSLFHPDSMTLSLVNQSNISLYNLQFTVLNDHASVETFTLDRLVSNGRSIIPLHTLFTPKNIQLSSADTVYAISVAKASHTFTLAISITLVAAASGIAVISGRLLVSRRRRESNLRRKS